MKKTLLTIASVAITVCAVAQHSIKPVITENKTTISLPNSELLKVASSSTLIPASMMSGGCATGTTTTGGIVYYEVNNYTITPSYTLDVRGYMFGTNLTTITPTTGAAIVYRTSKAAQKYSITGSASVTDYLLYVAKPKSDNATSMVTAKILSEDGTTKSPNAQLGSSATKSINSFTSGINVIHFPTAVPITAGKFFASLEFPTIGGATHDTIAVLSTKSGCSSTDSLSWVYEDDVPSTGNGAWYSIDNYYGTNLDIAIFPVIDITAGLNSISKNGLTLLAAYPNPATSEVSINFGLANNSKVTIEICDLTGKVISTSDLGNLIEGNHTSKLNVSQLASGVYMYSVKSNDAKMYSKFTVAK